MLCKLWGKGDIEKTQWYNIPDEIDKICRKGEHIADKMFVKEFQGYLKLGKEQSAGSHGGRKHPDNKQLQSIQRTFCL